LTSKEIHILVLQDDRTRLSDLINSLSVSDQLSIHTELDLESLRYITENRENLTLNYNALEHIVWNYYRQLPWSDELLIILLEEFKKERFIALESIIISAIKNDKTTREQIELISPEFTDKEIIRQLFFWEIRKKVNSQESLKSPEVKKLLDLKGYNLLLQAFEYRLISEFDSDLFIKPEPGSSDRKLKEKLYMKANEKEQ
jgi:hypothetical protein